MNIIKKSIILMLYGLFAASALTAAPSKEATKRLTAELQDIRDNLEKEAIEIFQDRDMSVKWDKATFEYSINGAKKPLPMNEITQPLFLIRDIETIVWGLGEAENDLYPSCIKYTYSETAERILRLKLYNSRFIRSTTAYLNSFSVFQEDLKQNVIFKHNTQRREDTCEENNYINNQIRTINAFMLSRAGSEMLAHTTDPLFSLLRLDFNANHTAKIISEEPTFTATKDEKATKNPKRARIDEDDDCDDDTQATQPVAQQAPKQPGLITLLHSQAHATNIIRKRSNIMAHQGVRDNFLKPEFESIARTMIDQATGALSWDNGIVWATTEAEQWYLGERRNLLRKTRDILRANKIAHSVPSILSITQKVSSYVSELEANDVKPYPKNLARIKQWQQHYQNVLNMALLYLNSIPAQEPEHIVQRDRLIHRFTQDFGVDVIPTLPPENSEYKTDLQRIMDLQRITLANKTTHALAGILKMQNMLYPEQNGVDGE